MERGRLQHSLVTAWLTTLVTVVVFSWMFFATQERHFAGEAVSLFLRVETWVGVLFAAMLLMARPSRAVRWLVIGMLVCSFTIYFGLQPMMAGLRAQAAAGSLTADLKTQFGLLHLGSVVFYAAEVILGVVLLLKVNRR